VAYKKLYAMGYRNLKVLDEGIPGWVEQGHPTEGWQAGGEAPPPWHGESPGQWPMKHP
jgi:hypothetical protein